MSVILNFAGGNHSILFCLVHVVLEIVSFLSLACWSETQRNKIDSTETVPPQLLKAELT